MAKKKAKKVQNSFQPPGLGGGFNPIGFPYNQGTGWSNQISQTTSAYVNLRWYLISNQRQVLNQMYAELGLIQTIVDVPVDDALRGGVMIQSKQLTEDQIEELSNSLDRDDDLNTIGQSAKWDRLFGGAGTLIFTDQDPMTPLNIKSIRPDEALEFRAADMWELTWDMQNASGYDPTNQAPEYEYYSYYGEKVHKSRVMVFKGKEAPSFIRPRLRGWGLSCCESFIRSLNQYLKATDLTFEVLDEFKLDIYKIKNLVNSLMTNDPQSVHRRIADANMQKNYQHAIVMDSEDDYLQKQLSFAGLAETMGQIRMQVASDLRMPMIKLFGQAAGGGLGSTGEDEIEVYNSMVESQVRNKLKYHVLRLCEIKCQKLFGFVPSDLSLDFAPLRVMSSEQEENVKTQKYNRLQAAFTAGAITREQLLLACNKGNLFDISIDVVDEQVDGGYLDDDIDEGKGEPTADDPDRETPYAADDVDDNAVDEHIDKAKNWFANMRAKFKNSDRFDKASYEADGGDSWTDDRRKYFYESPVTPSLYRECSDESQRLYGKQNWKFAVWLYLKRGGTFSVAGTAE